jgi:murein DD-endopeptidase MepM/ murein hydrolase activator NlpD
MLAPQLRQAGAAAGIDTSAVGTPGRDAFEAPAIAMPALPVVPAVAVPVVSALTAPVTSEVVSPVRLGPVSSAYGWRQDPFGKAMKFHKGTDIAMPAGQDVPVAQSGRVAFAGEQSGYGLTVVVEHEPGLSTRYAHLSAVDVAAGDAVILGQTIGKSGASGRATGPHLHFEVIDEGRPVDPALGLARLGTSLQAVD